MQLFRRVWRLTFFDPTGRVMAQYGQTTQQNGLRIQFRVLQNIGYVNNISEINIFGLSENSRSILMNAYSLTLEAGYDDNLKEIHNAKIINKFNNRRQPDFVFTLFTLDYLGVINPIFLNLQSTMTDREMIKKVAELMPGAIVQDGNLRGLKDLPVQKRIIIDRLTYKQAFAKLSDQLNINIWLTNNILYTSSRTPTTTIPPGVTMTILNYKNGMVGSPIIDVAQAGITVKSLLNASLLPGGYVKVETLQPQIQFGGANYTQFEQNSANAGEWQILTVEHIGDSRGDNESWISTVSGFGAKLFVQGVVT